ncbi:hypothetical protein ElyMa_000652300 [Elysia marginata]|uniref:Uncharacterized protein n=1 Tax=Elysia marginata TaxID=1093978 RepID=A0AAV4GET8_9GAST|nr:hypothetical protein ElyMa_000652300 [Elysia marginata]
MSCQNSKSASLEIPRFGYQSLPTDKKLRSADVSNSFIDEVEHRLLARMMGQQVKGDKRDVQSPMNACDSNSEFDQTGDTTRDFNSELGDDTLDASLEDLLTREAASLVDAPTLENVKLRLRQMQQEQKEIRQRWSSLKFYDSTAKSKIFSASEVLSHRPREPPALELGGHLKPDQRQPTNWPVSKEVVEVPLIFTKPATSGARPIQYLHTVCPGGTGVKGERDSPLSVASLQQPGKRLLSLKQTTAERIAAERSRFESYLKRRSHHPSGKFDPWALVDEISEEILMDCLKDISQEVEGINEEIANHMYKSEFLVEQTKSPPSDTVYRVQAEKLTPRGHSLKLSPQGYFGEGDRAVAKSETRSPTYGEAERSRAGLVTQTDYGDLHLTLSNDHVIISQRGSPVDRRPVTPRSPAGSLRAGSASPRGFRGGMSSPTGIAAAQSPPSRGGAGTGSGHLWRSSPVSPTGSGGQGGGGSSRSPTPRSPHITRSGEGGRFTPRSSGGMTGQRSPLRDGRHSPQVSASEPLLDDVSHLLPNKSSSEEESSEVSVGPDKRRMSKEMGKVSAGEMREGGRRTDNGNEDGSNEEDEEEDYSDEDFEDVTDVEL